MPCLPAISGLRLVLAIAMGALVYHGCHGCCVGREA
jgi:hypothetical protein